MSLKQLYEIGMRSHFTYVECVGLSTFIGRLVSNPHMICLSSLQRDEFMLFREFKNYPMSLFFMKGIELNIDSACFKARSLRSEEGNLPLKKNVSNKTW